jgi:hypothetical protein
MVKGTEIWNASGGEGKLMTTKSKRLILIIAVVMLVFSVTAVWSYSGDRPTIETKTTVYVVPWPWQLVYQDGALWMELEVQ